MCKDMPPTAWEVNFRVFELPTDYIAVLLARFCLPVKAETGHPYEAAELAEILGIAVSTYRFRLTQAKRYYRRLLFGAEVIELYPQCAV